MTAADNLKFESVDAISVGGSYTVNADGTVTRDHLSSTSLESIANGAPGAAAELKGAADGVTPARSEATSESTTADPTNPPKATKAKT